MYSSGGTSVGIQAFLGEFWALFQDMMLPGWNGMTPYAGDAEPPRLTCWRLTTTRVGGGRLSFFHARNLLSRKALLSRRVHTLACSFKSCLVVCCLAGGISYSSGPPIFVYTYISAYCRNRVTTSRAPASTTAFRILMICNGRWRGTSVSPSFSAPGFDIAAGQTGWSHPRDLSDSAAADFMGGLMYYFVQLIAKAGHLGRRRRGM